jgi:HEAT repeat protein
MFNRIGSLLKIRPEEGRLVLLVGGLFLCIQAGQGMGDNAASALFFLRFGVDFLPYMYLILGAVTFVLTLGYSAGLGRFERGRFFQSLILGLIALLILERMALQSSLPFLYPILWLTISCMGMILGTFTWNVAGQVTDARAAKRLFPLFASAGILGSVLGNSVTGLIAKSLGTDNLLIFHAVLLGLSYLLTRSITSEYFKAERPAQASSLWNDLGSGFDFVRNSSLMRLVAHASMLFSILFFSIAFPFNKVVTEAFPDEAGVAGFLGTFSSITTAVTFLISLLLASRVYAHLGVVNSVLLMPLVYIFGFTMFALQYSLNGAIIARFSQLVVLGGLAGTAWNALFNVIPSQKRGQVVAFQNGVPSQVGVALSGVLLILGEQVLNTTQVLLMGMTFTLICVALVWRMRKAYGQELMDALRAGRLEVFSSEESAFAGLQNDMAVLTVVTRGLEDAKPGTRRLSAEILGRMGNPSAIPSLTGHLTDTEPVVRAAVIRALGELHAPAALDELRAALDEQNIEVRTQAAVALIKMGEGQQAGTALTGWLKDEDATLRIATLEAMTQTGQRITEHVNASLLISMLDDPSHATRIGACHVLAYFDDPDVTNALMECLHDPQETIRKAAACSLRQKGTTVSQFIVTILDSNHEGAREAVLDALTPGDVQVHERLRKYAGEEIALLRALRGQASGLPATGRAVKFLRETLQEEVHRRESRLVKIVGLIGNSRAMELVQKGMRDPKPGTRAAALEALETLGDRNLTGEILSLLEEEPVGMGPANAIESSLAHESRWPRALAIRAVHELELKEFVSKVHELRSHSDRLIQETALDTLILYGEVQPMDTLQTVSTIERVLLLREIPIFADLSPEDLEQVARTAQEQWYPADTTIFRQDEEGNMMFIIVSGHLHVVRSTNGIQQVLAQRGPGDFVGEMAIIESAPRLASLLTQSEVRVLALEAETFKGILRERPNVSLAVLQSISRRLREMSQ